MGVQPNFFRTPGAREHAFPLYCLDDAQRLRSRILGVFEAADRDPGVIEQGALNFVIVGGGPTGVETAGSLADLIHGTMAGEFDELAVAAARIHIVDLGHALLGAFSDDAHAYVTKVLGPRGVQLHLGTAVTEVAAGHVALSDGTTIRTRCVVWGGGIRAPGLAGTAGLPQGRGGRVEVLPDLTVAGAPGVYAVGDMAIAFSAWLGVHAALMTGVRNRVDAFVSWGSDYFTHQRGPQVLDRSDAARIDWEDDAAPVAEILPTG